MQDTQIDEKLYYKRIWAWTMYDWANSAFATTILAVILPIYFSQVAGATLPSAARATAYWSSGLSISLLIVAILSPILGTISDISRTKKRFLALFAGLGIISTALLVLVETGDWVLASILAILGRVGFNGSLTFYDSLLPHVAKPEDQDRVSTRGFAIGYLGGGLLLVINVVMLQYLPGTWGARMSFLSVAIWWAVFSIPIFRWVPEPKTATARLESGIGIITTSFNRLGQTLRDISRYRDLFKFLLAFLIYNDGIGTIIGVAAIYGAEMGFDSTSLILALLLVQFVGFPYSLIFGRLPSKGEKRRPMYLAFILFNLIALPLIGITTSRYAPVNLTGMPPAIFETIGEFVGEGRYPSNDSALEFSDLWEAQIIPAQDLASDEEAVYYFSSTKGEKVSFRFNGQQINVIYATGPDYGIWKIEVDGNPLLDKYGEPIEINAENPALRYAESVLLDVGNPGKHTINLINAGEGAGSKMAIGEILVLPGVRQSNLGLIIGLILIVEVVCLLLAFITAPLFKGLAEKLDTKRSILLSLIIYSVIAMWGFILNSVVEFWFLAWMVAIVQGGSQALSRSLYAALSPRSKSGEFFGLFSVMEKFASLIGPLMFAAAAFYFSSSRPAILSLVVLFLIGGSILTFVNVEQGKQAARE